MTTENKSRNKSLELILRHFSIHIKIKNKYYIWNRYRKNIIYKGSFVLDLCLFIMHLSILLYVYVHLML